ncbi:MAG: methyltransferase [Sulfurospirillaceae bacterium]|nr:methyltransferase [Sulfurospirillaceae bacterium]
MTFYQYKNGYRYNSDTVFLYNFISKYNLKGEVLDVGCGCGILGLLLKRDFDQIKLTQIDIQEKNTILTQKNAATNNITTKVISDDFLIHDFDEKFDVIVSNPPFYHSGSLKSEDISLYLSRHSDALVFDDFVKKAYKLLNHRGSLIFCYDAKQIDIITASLINAKFKINELQFVHVDKNKPASLVMILAKRESKSLCKVLPSIVLYENKELTKDVQNFFIKADTNSEDI